MVLDFDPARANATVQNETITTKGQYIQFVTNDWYEFIMTNPQLMRFRVTNRPNINKLSFRNNGTTVKTLIKNKLNEYGINFKYVKWNDFSRDGINIRLEEIDNIPRGNVSNIAAVRNVRIQGRIRNRKLPAGTTRPRTNQAPRPRTPTRPPRRAKRPVRPRNLTYEEINNIQRNAAQVYNYFMNRNNTGIPKNVNLRPINNNVSNTIRRIRNKERTSGRKIMNASNNELMILLPLRRNKVRGVGGNFVPLFNALKNKRSRN